MQVCFIISFRPKLYKPITKVMPLSLLCGNTCEPRGKKYLFSCKNWIPSTQWVCWRNTKTHTHTHTDIWKETNMDDNISWMLCISQAPALFAVTFRHKAETQRMKADSGSVSDLNRNVYVMLQIPAQTANQFHYKWLWRRV